MGRYSAAKFKLWRGQPVNAPFISPPLSLRAFLVLCIVSVTGTLVYGVASELSVGAGPDESLWTLLAIVFLYFLLPMLIAYTIATNRAASRELILVYLVAVFYRLAVAADVGRLASSDRAAVATVICGLFLLILWWLYRSPKLRLYYALVAGKEIPDDLRARADALLGPGRLESIFGRVARCLAPWFETVAVVLVLFGLIVAISWTGRW